MDENVFDPVESINAHNNPLTMLNKSRGGSTVRAHECDHVHTLQGELAEPATGGDLDRRISACSKCRWISFGHLDVPLTELSQRQQMSTEPRRKNFPK